MYKLVLVALFSFAFVFAGCDDKAENSGGVRIEGNDSYEATVFRQNCAICHGAEAFGKTVNGRVIPPLRSGKAALKSEEEIYQQIANGKLPMPSFRKQLTEDEMRRMARFVYTQLQGRKLPEKSR
ncbi:MAG: cytochrome c [Pyrinomonadaceae bacterium]